MQIIDEHGSPIENPDLTKGYLKQETQTIHHDAVAAVEPVTHYEYKEYPNGGRDRITVVDVPGVEAKDAWDEEEQVQVYHVYTAEELAAQEEARKKAEAREKLPDAVAALQEDNKTLKKENEMLKQCLLEMSEIVYA